MPISLREVLRHHLSANQNSDYVIIFDSIDSRFDSLVRLARTFMRLMTLHNLLFLLLLLVPLYHFWLIPPAETPKDDPSHLFLCISSLEDMYEE
jgi:hypothetical protein